jgi:hypothetical protein
LDIFWDGELQFAAIESLDVVDAELLDSRNIEEYELTVCNTETK